MKSKSTLVLMELTVMILVFALASAVCMRSFAAAENISQQSAALDRAVLEAQQAAEAMKAGNTDYFGTHTLPGSHARAYQITYDKDWNRIAPFSDTACYFLTAEAPEENEYLWKGYVSVCCLDGEELCRLPIAGQRETDLHEQAAIRAAEVAEQAAGLLLPALVSQPDAVSVFSAAADSLGGVVKQGVLWAAYDENWNVLDPAQSGAYRLYAMELPRGEDGLCRAQVWVSDMACDATLYLTEFTWQEVVK
ncbi:MAG: hypothetical protein IKD01_01685 [Oscillospiraceae bacterium]|nr:hypothetical protein [Oscillospiraceae bacterium]